MTQQPAKTADNSRYIALAYKILLESVDKAAGESRHGHDQLKITYHAGEIRQIEFVPSTTYKI